MKNISFCCSLFVSFTLLFLVLVSCSKNEDPAQITIPLANMKDALVITSSQAKLGGTIVGNGLPLVGGRSLMMAALKYSVAGFGGVLRQRLPYLIPFPATEPAWEVSQVSLQVCISIQLFM